ncbi:MAG: FAD-binding oxidoreductase [Candidatus Rariloculaceae bacterium]
MSVKGDTNNSNKILTTLRRELGEEAIIAGTDLSDKYAVDISGENPRRPIAVILPKSTGDVSTILRLCSEAGQRIVVQGGLTGLSGGATPQAGELALSIEKLTGIDSLDLPSSTLTVQAGTTLQAIQKAAGEAGLLFPLDLGARGSCQIGGLIATNAGGNQVLRFGMARNLVLGLEVVLPDGTVVSSMNRMLKNNAGYDLKQLFIGTEGTLGVVTRAVLRLYPQMPSTCTALCAVRSFPDIISLLRQTQIEVGSSLSAYEVMWASYFDYVTDYIEKLQSPFAHSYPLYALIETEGTNAATDMERFERALGAALESGVIEDAVVAKSEKEAQTFWSIRDGIAEITTALTPYAGVDVSLSISDMPAFLEQVNQQLKLRFNEVVNLVFGHVGDCNLHLFITTGKEEDVDHILALVYKITGEYEGSISAEHGIGTLKREYLHYSRNDAEVALMRNLKQTLDPKGILNNHRVI